MAGPWCFDCPPALTLFQQASEVLGYDLLEVCTNGPAEELNTTAVSQPALLVTSLAMLEVLRLQDGSPFAPGSDESCTAGLSLGEYSALVHAGALDVQSAVRIVNVRGRAMQACADA